MYISESEARVHNLVLRMYKKYINEDGKSKIENDLSAEKLNNDLFLREIDLQYLIQEGLIEYDGEKYQPTIKLHEKINYLKKKHDRRGVDKELESYIIDYYNDLKKETRYRISEKAREIASKIHWKILPEYEEYMMVNGGYYPSDDTEEYYNHFHAIEDLYNELTGNGKNVNSRKGDDSLNKKIEFTVYSRRWGHKDKYYITRTTKGWDVEFHQTRKGDKEGSALIDTLRHDLINYPASLGNFMYDLWNRADDGRVGFDNLAEHLKHIEKWINICEENTPEGIEE